MALREFLRRPAINALIKFRNRNLKKQIFFSHSNKDYKLIETINYNFEYHFEKIGVHPFFARRWITGQEPLEKIINAIWNSRAVFILLTKNVLNDPITRDWVSFETGIAKTLADVEYFQIFGWKSYDIKLTDLFQRITDFQEFNPNNDKDRLRVVEDMMNLAIQL